MSGTADSRPPSDESSVSVGWRLTRANDRASAPGGAFRRGLLAFLASDLLANLLEGSPDRRDTCICEIPTCSAICDWVSPLKNRRWRIIRSRSSSTRKPGASTARSSEISYCGSSAPSDSSGSSSPSLVLPPPGRERHRAVRPAALERLDDELLLFAPDALASSGIVGERPSSTVDSSTSFESWTFSSWRPGERAPTSPCRGSGA